MGSNNAANMPLPFAAENITLAHWVEGINSELLGTLRALAAGDSQNGEAGGGDGGALLPPVHIWGDNSSGKTTLLRAVFNDAKRSGQNAFWLGAADAGVALNDTPDTPDAPDSGDTGAAAHALPPLATGLLIIDDLERLSPPGQLTLYDWLNRGGGNILTAAAAVPQDLPLDLALASRLSGGLRYRLRPLRDDDKRHALSRWAARRGFALAPPISALLLQHLPRDMHNLTQALSNLDYFLLTSKKSLTLARARQWINCFSPGSATAEGAAEGAAGAASNMPSDMPSDVSSDAWRQ